MIKIIKTLPYLGICVLTGCASIFNGANQNVTISTTNANKEVTQCSLENEEGQWKSAPNVAVSIHRDGNPMKVECNNNSQKGEILVSPKFDGVYLFTDFLIDFAIISGSIDAFNNAFYDYPPYITLNMEDTLKTQPQIIKKPSEQSNLPLSKPAIDPMSKTNDESHVDDISMQLKKLKELLDSGLLTKKEYESRRKALVEKI